MNKVFLIGNLTRDPELTETPSGVSVCKFGLAVSRPYTQGDGERITDFFNCVAWRGLGETIARYVKKGHKLAVSGSMESRSYDDNEGNKRTVWELIVRDSEFIQPRERDDGYGEAAPQSAPSGRKKPTLQAMDDDGDIPF